MKVTKKSMSGSLSLVLLSTMISPGCSILERNEEPPNIIFLLTDDHQWRDLGAAGNEIIQTPNLDHLANNGIMFTHAMVTTSICMASRASILTGQYTSRHGITNFTTDLSEEAKALTYPMLLKHQAGYNTGFIGKYGIGIHNHPVDKYDYWACERMYQPNYENWDEHGNFRHYTDIVRDRMDTFLLDFGNRGPFCLSVSFKAPHVQDGDPRQFIYNPRYKDLYAGVAIPLPETYDSSYYYFFPERWRFPVTENPERENEARRRWEMRFPNPEKYQESVRSYYRLLTGVDDAVGDLLKRLEELGLSDNTIIIFMGDNGFYLGEHGLAGKWYPHEESVRVPFFIYDPRAPKRRRGLKVDEFALNIDVAPTILALANVERPEGMQGIDALSLIRRNAPRRDTIYYEHPINMAVIPWSEAVITKETKYILYPTLSPSFEELYNLKKDPLEKHSLVDDPEYASVLLEMRQKMEEMREKVK